MQTTFLEPAEILLHHDKRLRAVAEAVSDWNSPELSNLCDRLMATLDDFRDRNGFGRAIASPQIGVARRVIAFNLNGDKFVMINPVIVDRSQDTFTMWDDCMSFPDLLVKVRRHCSVSVEFQDISGHERQMSNLAQAESELVQHELDHLDGILALDRALDESSIITRTDYLADPQKFRQMVDYVIY